MSGQLWRVVALQTFLIVLASPLAAEAASKIGVASATQNDVQGFQGSTSRSLAAGSQVFQDETVRTGAKSMAQLLFLDETSLSIGPQSEVKLDKFVFNPATGTGNVVISATKGVFRFITGSQAPVNYQLKTAVATIGVRGTIVDSQLSPAGLFIQAQEGRVILLVNGVEYVLGPGEALFISSPDKTVTGPFTPDGEFFRVAGIVPFSLYGSLLPGEHEQIEVPDDSTVRADDLFDHLVPPPDEPPVEDDDPCDYETSLKAPLHPDRAIFARDLVVLAAGCL